MSDPKTPLVDVRHLKEYFKVNINAFLPVPRPEGG